MEQKQQYEQLLGEFSHNEYIMSYWESLGLATALAIAPQLILPTQWVPVVLAGDVPNSNQAASNVVGIISANIKATRLQFEDNKFLMPLSLDIESDTNQRNNLSLWCSGFMQGVYIDENNWFSDKADTIFNLLMPIYILSGHEKYASRLGTNQGPIPDNTLSTLIPDLLDAVFKVFHQLQQS